MQKAKGLVGPLVEPLILKTHGPIDANVLNVYYSTMMARVGVQGSRMHIRQGWLALRSN